MLFFYRSGLIFKYPSNVMILQYISGHGCLKINPSLLFGNRLFLEECSGVVSCCPLYASYCRHPSLERLVSFNNYTLGRIDKKFIAAYPNKFIEKGM